MHDVDQMFFFVDVKQTPLELVESLFNLTQIEDLVIVVTTSGDLLRPVIETAHALGLTTGSFAWVTPQYMRSALNNLPASLLPRQLFTLAVSSESLNVSEHVIVRHIHLF